jgi:hypothetical protein
MKHDLLTRLYLRQYAFLTRTRAHQTASARYHFATLAVSALVSLAGLAMLAFGFWFASRVLNKLIVPWAAPDWLILVVSSALVLLPGFYIDKKMSPLTFVDENVIAFYSAPSQRFRWWLGVLSILPLGGVVAACFGALRTGA